VLERLRRQCAHIWLYLAALGKWAVLAAVTGVCCGFAGSAFHVGVARATLLREANPWLLWCLPLAGLAIVALYRLTGTEGQGTNEVIESVHLGRGLPLLLIPAIFVSTLLTHLCGGSAGREGAALQMGGDIGRHVGVLMRMDDRDLRTATLCGMASFFSALFGTPLAATMFALMVVSVGIFYHAAFLPAFLASLISYGISLRLGVEPTRFAVSVPDLSAGMLLRVAALGALCALVSILFCTVLQTAGRLMEKWISSPWLRAAFGGFAVIALTLLCGTSDYNGAGMDVIAAAIERGRAMPAGFLLKILFTALTLGAGYKGGEVVPSFFIGATFGCAAGSLLGIPAGFSAAVGLAAVFCASVNCPVASMFLACELFGGDGLLYFALACGISYLLSGYRGLYSSQTILYSKLKAQYINVRTNHHHAGELHENSPADTGSLMDGPDSGERS
jgi:Chloride channel protein EriC